MKDFGAKVRNEEVPAEMHDNFGRPISEARRIQIVRGTEINEAKRKQADRRTLLSMVDRLEVMSIEAKYLNLSNRNEEDIQYIIDSALKSITEFSK